MTDMVERAVAAGLKRGGSLEDQYTAALLAALDPEDEELRKLFGYMVYCCEANEKGGREAIEMLRVKIAQGEKS